MVSTEPQLFSPPIQIESGEELAFLNLKLFYDIRKKKRDLDRLLLKKPYQMKIWFKSDPSIFFIWYMDKSEIKFSNLRLAFHINIYEAVDRLEKIVAARKYATRTYLKTISRRSGITKKNGEIEKKNLSSNGEGKKDNQEAQQEELFEAKEKA